MGRWPTRGRLALTTLLAVAVLAACSSGGETGGAGASSQGGAQASGEPQAGGSLTWLKAGTTPSNWDPVTPGNQGNEATTGNAAFLTAVYGMLAIEDLESGEILPAMASAIEPTDATHWTLTLQPGITFSDETPYDAEAIKFNWERHADPANTSPNAHIAQNFESLEVVDETTLEITLREPNAQFDRTVARNLSYIGSPTAISEDLDGFRSRPVGAGPFVLDSYTANQTATFTRNPTYWDSPRPYLDELTITAMGDNEQRYNTFAAGQADVVQIFSGLANVARAEQEGHVVITNPPGGGGHGMVVNHARPPFDDPIAREAVRHMLDVEQETATVDHGVVGPLTNVFPERSPYHDPSITVPGYDAERAADLLDQYEEETGEPLSFTIVAADVTRESAEFYQTQLREFPNVEVQVEIVAANQFVDDLANGSFDLGFYPFAFGDPIGETTLMLGTGGAKNFGQYSNPELDALLAEASQTLDADERVSIYQEAEQLLLADDAFIFTKERPEVLATTTAVQGLGFAIEGIPLWDRIWLDQ